MEFAARAWPGAEILVTTHCDANHVHSHFIINSVNFETGLKLRQDPNTLKFLRLVSDDICMAHGFSVLPKYEGGGKKMSAREWRAAQKGQSWKFRLMYDFSDAMKKSQSKEDFITHETKRIRSQVDRRTEGHHLHLSQWNEVQRKPSASGTIQKGEY